MRKIVFWAVMMQSIHNLLTGATVESFRNPAMQNIMQFNRDTLSQVSTWLLRNEDGTILDTYMLPQVVIENIDKPIGKEITYSDLLNYFSTYLNGEIQFLELGVSVGKNLFQVCKFLKHAKLVGVDCLEINKPLENLFMGKEVLDCWPSYSLTQSKYDLLDLIRKYQIRNDDILKYYQSEVSRNQKISSITKYNYSTNEFYFISGMILDENIWQKMAARSFKFNLLFSDAYHVNEAVLYEYEMMTKYQLIADEFIFIWDDLNVVKYAFDKIWEDLNKKHPGKLKKFEFPIRGWIGNHGNDWHHIGIIMKLKDNVLKKQPA
jgi:hypothetical protein